ncbi:hypothetical protein MA16_Dca013128 [Dendrobium catenatum]|uniref:Uncharacterized protein n=1 Tax=Dendrobium catenatum TaxID=906689 RepID=A0A2I0WD70_9ASPA|nr:hypothetical protein MA16_Dca013128 [Dendrobium catenatum]
MILFLGITKLEIKFERPQRFTVAMAQQQPRKYTKGKILFIHKLKKKTEKMVAATYVECLSGDQSECVTSSCAGYHGSVPLT